MVVAVQKGLTEIKGQLRQLGYDVVTMGEYNFPIDALVYVGRGIDMSSFTSDVSTQGNNLGILLINASNKSINDIDNMLKKRVYSPLF